MGWRAFLPQLWNRGWRTPVGKPIDKLSDEERIAFYRALALESAQRAQIADTDHHKAAYLDIAQRWAAIADEVEQLMRRELERAARLGPRREQPFVGKLREP